MWCQGRKLKIWICLCLAALITDEFCICIANGGVQSYMGQNNMADQLPVAVLGLKLHLHLCHHNVWLMKSDVWGQSPSFHAGTAFNPVKKHWNTTLTHWICLKHLFQTVVTEKHCHLLTSCFWPPEVQYSVSNFWAKFLSLYMLNAALFVPTRSWDNTFKCNCFRQTFTDQIHVLALTESSLV